MGGKADESREDSEVNIDFRSDGLSEVVCSGRGRTARSGS